MTYTYQDDNFEKLCGVFGEISWKEIEKMEKMPDFLVINLFSFPRISPV